MEGDPDRAGEVHLPVAARRSPSRRRRSMPIARGRAGPSLLAMILYAKFGEHQPLNRQSEAMPARASISTSRPWPIGSAPAPPALAPLVELIRRHVLRRRAHSRRRHDGAGAGQGQDHHRRDYGPMCATTGRSAGRTRRPRSSSTRATATASIPRGISPAMPGSCRPMPMPGSAISTMRRRKTGADHRGGVLEPRPAQLLRAGRCSRKAPLAVEAVRRIDAIFAIEREINGLAADDRLTARQKRVAPLVGELENWMRAERARLSRHADIAKAIDYMLKRWPAFTRFLDDGRICLTNNAAERALARHCPRAQGMVVRRLRSRRRAGRGDVHPDRHRQAQRHRSARLARRRAAPHRRSSGLPARRAAALAMAKPETQAAA